MDFIKKYRYWLMCLPIIAITLFFTSLHVVPNDYWWHFKAGEYIVTNKAIPFTDVFSWIGVQEGLYWHSHEWLTEVVLYLNSFILGEYSGYIFALVSVIILVVLLYVFNKNEYMNNLEFTFIWVLIGSKLLSISVSPRPHMISFILLAITMYLIYNFKQNENSKKIWLIPLVSIAWANFHGGSSNLPYVLIFMVVITGLFDFTIGKIKSTKLTKKQIKTYLTVAFCSVLVLGLNPHGFSIVSYPYANMQDTFMLFNILEWRTPDLKKACDLIIYITMAMPILAFITTKRKIDFTDLGMALAFIFLTEKSIRFGVLLYIVCTFFIFKYIKEIEFTLFKKTKIQNLICKVILVFSCSLIITMPMLIISENIPKTLFEPPISDELVDYIQEQKPERLFNNYDIGGYLIYKDIPVFVDGRADMYSAGGTLREGMRFDDMGVDVEDTISKYDFDMLVISVDSKLGQYLKHSTKYEEVMRDKDYVIFNEIKK